MTKVNHQLKLAEMMCLEDATETADIFVDGAGEAYDAVDNGLERESGFMGTRYIKKKEISFEKKKRVDLLDLKDQGPGEFHLLNMATLLRGRSFYANPMKPKELRVNTFIRVKPPAYHEINTTKVALVELKKKFGEVLKSEKSISGLWNSHVDDDSKEFSKNLTFLVDKDSLTQAAFSMALRRNAIDLIDQTMVLKLKELETVINRELSPSEEFVDVDSFEKVSSEGLDKAAKQMNVAESPKDRLVRLVKENEDIIVNEIDLNTNPLTSFDVELDYASDTIESLSNDILKRWKSKGMLDSDGIVTSPDLQVDLAYAASQELLLSGNNFKRVVENEKGDMESFDFDTLTQAN